MTTDAIAVDETRDRAARPAGRLLLAGSPLFAAGVAGEWVLDPQLANGDVTRPAVFALCVGTSMVGAALLLGGVSRMTRVLPEGRAARWGGRSCRPCRSGTCSRSARSPRSWRWASSSGPR